VHSPEDEAAYFEAAAAKAARETDGETEPAKAPKLADFDERSNLAAFIDPQSPSTPFSGGNRMAGMNMDDPAKQEQIRRGHHEYIPTAGKHGTYVPKQYKHQEYPKMLGKWPRPELKHFQMVNGVAIPSDLAASNYQAAMMDWDRAMTASTVNNAAEERAWLKENGN
jgi:hypothetical protein